MANLKAGTLIGGNLIWNAGNMPLRTLDRRLFINEDEVYTTFKKPTPAEVGAVNKAGDTMTGDLVVQRKGASSIVRIKADDNLDAQLILEEGTTDLGKNGVYIRYQGQDNIFRLGMINDGAWKDSLQISRTNAQATWKQSVTFDNGITLTAGDFTLNNRYLKGANNSIILRDHANGNVTLSAGLNASGQPGDLYLGYTAAASGTAGYNTRKVLLRAPMDWEAKHNLINGEGKINSEQFAGPIRTEKGSDNVYHTIIGGTDTVNRGRVIIAAGECGQKIYDNTSSGEETVHIGGDGNAAIWLHTGLQNAWGDATHKRVKVDQGELYAVDGTKKVFHDDNKPFKVHHIGKPAGLTDGRYYPILITGATNNQELYINTRQSGGADPMNCASFAGQVRAMGWSDGNSYVDGMFTIYNTGERAIHSIYDHTENTGIYAIYVEARAFPIVLRVDSSCTVQCTGTDMPSGAGGVFPANLTSAQLDSGSVGGAKNRMARNFNLGSGYYRMDGFVNNLAHKVSGAVNFDSLINGGTFNLYATNVTGSINPPPFSYGTLLVIGTSSFANTFVTQIATERGNRTTFIRTRNDNGSWTAWVKSYDEANKPTPAELGAVNKAGDTMSGNFAVSGNTQFGASADRTSWGSGGIRGLMNDMVEVVTPTNADHDSATGIVFHNRGTSTSALYFKNDNASSGYFNFRSDETTWDVRINNNKIYHQGFKPTATDVGALPISGGNLTGLLYAKKAVIAESPDGKNWVALESIDNTSMPYISSKINNAAKKEIEFTSNEIKFVKTIVNDGAFIYRRAAAGGFYLNSTKDVSKNKWSFGIQTDNTGLIGKWKEDGSWDRSILEFHPTEAKVTTNGNLSVKGTVCEIGFADNTNLHLWFRKANGTERSLIWSDEEQIRIRHKEGNWLGVRQNGSVHTSANPPQMNEGVYNGTTVGGVWRRGQGVFHAKVAHQGSSWAPMFSAYFHDTEGYDGFYTFGHLSSAGAGVGTYCLQFMDGAGNANKAWSFNGSNGDFVSPGNVVAYSDIRVKTKIEKIENALDKIDQITGVTYDRTDVVTSRQMGVIAQDVEKVAPEVVTRTQHGELGEILGVSYGNLVGLLIEGIKELRGELAELKTQMNK